MIKCIICANHQQEGRKHTCKKCDTKTTYGELQEPFFEACQFYEMTEAEKKRREYWARVKSLPIVDEDGRGRPKKNGGGQK